MKRLIKYFSCIVIPAFCIALIFANSEAVFNTVDDTDVYPVIIIDAGHGGIDGGAVAADGTEEKHINLDIALKMNEYLTDAGYSTLMTRSDDLSIHDLTAETVREKKVSDIHNRMSVIECNPDSIFVSVHQNYFTESQYSGTQVFYSPNDPASIVLAQAIQSQVVSSLQPDNDRQIKQSGDSIYLLYNSTVPSVMVECGFLSNAEETEKLKSEEYRSQMAAAICEGIIKYLNGNEESSSVADDGVN